MNKTSKKELQEFLNGKKLFVENKIKEVKDILKVIYGVPAISDTPSYWLTFNATGASFVSAKTYYEELADADEVILGEFLSISEEDFCDWEIGDILVTEEKQPFVFGGFNGKFIVALAGFNNYGEFIPYSRSRWTLSAKKGDAVAISKVNKALREHGLVFDETRNKLVEEFPRVMPGRKFFFIAPDFSKKEYRVYYATEDGASEGLPFLFHKQRNYFYSKEDALAAISKKDF